MNVRAPPLKSVALSIAVVIGSLLVMFALAQISCITGASLMNLILGFPVVVVALKLALKT